jgi:hypothetical protein
MIISQVPVYVDNFQDFSLLVGCAEFLWSLFVIAFMVMIWSRLSAIQRLLEVQLKWMEAQYKAAQTLPPAVPKAPDGTARSVPPTRPT